jgi:hypothetical protein
MRVEVPWTVRCGCFSRQMFELGEDLFDRVEIGAIGRQEEQPCVCSPDRGTNGSALVAAEIIQDRAFGFTGVSGSRRVTQLIKTLDLCTKLGTRGRRAELGQLAAPRLGLPRAICIARLSLIRLQIVPLGALLRLFDATLLLRQLLAESVVAALPIDGERDRPAKGEQCERHGDESDEFD